MARQGGATGRPKAVPDERNPAGELGASWAPPSLLGGEATGRLIPVLSDFPTPEMPINAIYPHRQFVPSKVKSFIDLALKEFHNAAWNGAELYQPD